MQRESTAHGSEPERPMYGPEGRWTQLREERDCYRAALEAIRDHGKTHDQPCWAISNGDCADVMQEIARSALSVVQGVEQDHA